MANDIKNKQTKVGSKGMHGPMGGPPGGMKVKAKDFKGTIKKLLNYMSKYKIALVIVFIFSILSTVFNIVGPKLLGNATTIIFDGVFGKIAGTAGIDFDGILNIVIKLIVLYVLSALFMYIYGYIMANITMKITYKLRKDISEKINRLPLRYFDSVSHGDILSRVTNDIDTLSQTLNQSLTSIVTAVVSIIGILVMMISISWVLTLIALAIIPLTVIITLLVVKKSQKYFKDQQEYLGHINGHIEEVYGGNTVIKSFNREEQVIKKFDEYNNVLYESSWKSQFYSALMMPILNSISNIGYVLICIIGGFLTTQGSMSIGGIQSFMQYIRQFNQPLLQVANIVNVFQQAAASAERVFEFLDEAEEETENKDLLIINKNETDKVDDKHVWLDGSVQFKNVKFGYNPDNIIINDFSAEAKPRQKIAIVGPTGAGKSTMIKLLMRFYDVNEGSIEVNHNNIKNFSRDDIRKEFGMVLQETWLFCGTIKENIRYGKLDATDEEIYKAAKLAQVDHFIRTLPDGYNTMIDEEISNLSQGQKQLLTIARAVLNNPSALILDEATSSVDTRTEQLIAKAMDKMMAGRTSFVIAHRLSTIVDADLILVMKDGDVIEQGTHQELLDKGGFYSKLYNSQFSKVG